MKKLLVILVVLALSMFGVSAAFAYDVKVDEDTFAKVGAKGIIRYTMTNPDTTHDRMDATVAQGRVYFAGQVTDMYKFGLNFDMSKTRAANGNDTTQGNSLSDAYIMLDFAKEFKVMTGIYRMAVSRVALQDTYQFILPNAPEVAGAAFLSNTGTTGLAGYRSGGITLWGDLADGMVRYNLGVWDGDYSPVKSDWEFSSATVTPLGTNPNDELGMSARVVINFMDPEKGYTCAGCYLGKAKVANVGVGYYTQDYIAGTAGERTYTVTTVDAFYDADGITAEAAYFQYDSDDNYKPTAWYVEAAYAMGKIQPAVRYESWDDDDAGEDYEKIVAGVNYLVDGHNAKVGLAYEMKDWDDNDGLAVEDTDTFILQLQVQF